MKNEKKKIWRKCHKSYYCFCVRSTRASSAAATALPFHLWFFSFFFTSTQRYATQKRYSFVSHTYFSFFFTFYFYELVCWLPPICVTFILCILFSSFLVKVSSKCEYKKENTKNIITKLCICHHLYCILEEKRKKKKKKNETEQNKNIYIICNKNDLKKCSQEKMS